MKTSAKLINLYLAWPRKYGSRQKLAQNQDWKRHINTDHEEIKIFIKEYYEQLYANKLNNWSKINWQIPRKTQITIININIKSEKIYITKLHIVNPAPMHVNNF